MMKPIRNTSIGFIGAGNVGTVLAVALRRLGYRVVAVNSRTLASAAALASRIPGCQALEAPQQVSDLCSLVFLTVPDDAIAGLVRSLHWRKDQVVVHCSGAEPLESLAPAQAAGALVGAFHPLQIFPERGADPSIFYGITFGIEAVSPLLEEMESLARELKGYPFRLSASDRVLYHLSGVVACGFVVTLLNEATRLFVASDSDVQARSKALRSLLPLVRGTVEAVEKRGLAGALTGPFTRGDIGTVQRHLDTIEARVPEFLALYCQLGLAQLPLAVERGKASPEDIEEIRKLLEEGLEQHRRLAAEGAKRPVS